MDVSGTWYTSSLRGGNWARLLAAFVGSNPTVYTNLGKRKAKMKTVMIALAIVSINALADVKDPKWQDPHAKFDTANNFTFKTTVTHRPVDNVQQECEKESRKRGLGGFGYGVDACSFWENNSCTIITPKKTTTTILGHEMRHCLQGAFH